MLTVDGTPEAGELPPDGEVVSVVCSPETCMEELPRTLDVPAPGDLFLSCPGT